MSELEVREKILEILVANLGHNDFEFNDELTAGDVRGWDSLSHMAIITGIEERFQIKFKIREINKLKNMKTLIELVQSKI
jgi:acyl carrier protein